MTDVHRLFTPLFLDKKEIEKLIEILFFCYKDLSIETNEILRKIEFSRSHHLIIYFIGKNEKITNKNLLKILKISKQSLSRLINQLVEKKYVSILKGSDKRTKTLSLTKKGKELESKLTSIQINKIRNKIKNASEREINSFKMILFELCDQDSKIIFNKLNK
tara:strand:- start:160 stop:645 length:486 start_codon:yes stop_codon:yes gene_type:complete